MPNLSRGALDMDTIALWKFLFRFRIRGIVFAIMVGGKLIAKPACSVRVSRT